MPLHTRETPDLVKDHAGSAELIHDQSIDLLRPGGLDLVA
jgi:hypothetical protein